MNYTTVGKAVLLLTICGSCGCRSPGDSSSEAKPDAERKESEHPADLKEHIRDNCASLLYDLLNDEKNVVKLLIIKHESDDLHQLVKDISATAGDGAGRLEQLAAADSTLDLHAMGLPSGEAATREAVAKTKGGELLRASGTDFEFKLLLTQAEAMNYGMHLAKVAAANALNPDQAREFSTLRDRLTNLHQRIIAQLQKSRG